MKTGARSRFAKPWLLVAIIVVTVAAATYYLLFGRSETKPLFSVASQNGKMIATVASVARGGATVGYSYGVWVHARARGFKSGTKVWASYRVMPRELVWLGPTSFAVVVDRAEFNHYRAFVDLREGAGITVTTDAR